VLAALWAREKIDSLVHGGVATREEVTQLGLDYRLMTPYTSFVAVEETIITEGGASRRVDVPVDIPNGVSYDGVFGEDPRELVAMPVAQLAITTGFTGPYRASLRSEARRESKLSPELAAATGMVRIQVLLNTDSEATMAELKKLGFVVIAKPQTAKLVIGRISATKLKELAALAAVRYIAPAA
jgi:Ca-activated chloride channel family protein